MLTRSPLTPAAARGFTLIEMLGAVVIAGVLVSVALPAYTAHVRKARRADALAAISAVQQAQERHRADHLQYGSHLVVVDGQWRGVGSSVDFGATAAWTAAGGHYRLSIHDPDASGYRVVATALGDQARDAGCGVLRASVRGAQLTYDSGPTAALGNDTAANRRCWSR